MSGISTVAIGLILCLVLGSAAAAQAQGAVKSSEWGLRSRAKASPMPAYPRESLAEKTSGVAVAAVLFGVDGKLASIDILEAPDEHMAAAVRDAVERWNVPGAQVMGRDERSPIQGKLTFYFQVRNGKAVVLDPDEMPGGSPRPSRARHPRRRRLAHRRSARPLAARRRAAPLTRRRPSPSRTSRSCRSRPSSWTSASATPSSGATGQAQ